MNSPHTRGRVGCVCVCGVLLPDAQNRVKRHMFLTSAFWAAAREVSHGKSSLEAHPSSIAGCCKWATPASLSPFWAFAQNTRFQPRGGPEKFTEMTRCWAEIDLATCAALLPPAWQAQLKGRLCCVQFQKPLTVISFLLQPSGLKLCTNHPT